MSTVTGGSFAEVLERMVAAGKADLPPDAARYFLELRFADADCARMNALAAKAHGGVLGSEEEAELANYMQIGCFLDLIKSKARLSLGLADG